MDGGVSRPGQRVVRLARINVALAGVFVALVTGPVIVHWFRAHGAPPPASPTGQASPATPLSPVESPPSPSRVEPTPSPVTSAPLAALSPDVVAPSSAGTVAEPCDEYREMASRTGAEEARRNLGTCLGRLGREAYEANQPELAALRYQRAVDAYPDASELWTSLATAHAKAGAFGRAQAVLQEAIGRFPDDADARYLLADVQERQGRTREAVETLRQLLAAHPSHARGQRLLATLEREEKVEGSYWAQDSAHFLVRYEGARGIDLGRSVVDVLEEAYESIGRDLATYPKDRVQVGIYSTPVFGDVIGGPPHLIAGAYDGRKIRLNISASITASRALTRMVRHEYTHLLIHLAASGHAPIWLHEGLAQAEEPRSAPRLLPVAGIPRRSLSLGGIERLSRTGNIEALSAGYSLTLVAVQFLLERGGFSAMRDFLARLGRGEALPAAMQAAYGFGPEDVEARLLAAAGKS